MQRHAKCTNTRICIGRGFKWSTAHPANTPNARDTYTHLFLKEQRVAEQRRRPSLLVVRARELAGCANPNHRALLKNLAVQCQYLSPLSLLKCTQLNKPCLPLGAIPHFSSPSPRSLSLVPAVIRERKRRQAVERQLREFTTLARRLTHHYDNLFVQLGKEVCT